MYLIVSKYLIPRGFRGLTLFPFVFVKYKVDKDNTVFINHEKIHIRQQIEFLIVPFYLWYILEFFIRWIQFKDKDLAYRNISFEKEAYTNERNLAYLKQRPFWEIRNYF